MHKIEADSPLRVPRQQTIEREEHSRLGVCLVILFTAGFWTTIICLLRSC